MREDAFVVVFLKPEIAAGYFKFATSGSSSQATKPEDTDGAAAVPAVASSSIAGVSAVEAAFLLPNGHIVPTLLARIKEAGFEIAQRHMKQLSRAEARHLFSYELRQRLEGDEDAFGAFLTAITCGPSLVLLLTLPGSASAGDANAAIKKWNQLAGPWDPIVARKQALAASVPHDQWPLRALCGLNALQNGLSNSPHVCCARRERFLLFPPAASYLERATIVLLPTFHSNFPEGKDTLLSALGHKARSVVVTTSEGCRLSAENVLHLCELSSDTEDDGPAKQTRDDVIQLAEQVVSDKGVDVLAVEGLDLKYTLQAIVGPADVELARVYFPDSLRAQVPTKLRSVELPTGLSHDDALGFESGLFLSFDPKLQLDLAEDKPRDRLLGAPRDGPPVELTLGLIKPNAACKPEVVAEILRTINQFGFVVERQRRLQLSRDQAAAFYAEHHGKAFFETLLHFMTSGEIVALELSRTHAIRVWRGIMGPTNSLKARETHPWTLRARFGVDGTRNATHGSDSSTSAARELRFFFGSALAPSAITIRSATPALSVQAVVQRPIGMPGTAHSSMEKVLTQGLKELVTLNLSEPLEACQWLGHWLLNYQSRGLEEDPAAPEGPTKPKFVSKPDNIARTSPEEGVKRLGDRKVVAISVDESLDAAVCTTLADVVRERLEPARYIVIDVASEVRQHQTLDTAVGAIVKTLKESGRRRCVLFISGQCPLPAFFGSFNSLAPVTWLPNFAARIGSFKTDPAVFALPDQLQNMPGMYVRLSAGSSSGQKQLQSDDALRGLFQTVFDPLVVLLADPQRLVPVHLYGDVATRFGFRWLTFDAFIASVKASKDEQLESCQLRELLRSGATLPPALILSVLRRTILGAQPEGDSCAQKFLLMGFPWDQLRPSALERAIGRPRRVLLVGQGRDRFQLAADLPEPPLWTAMFRKSGLVKRIWVDSTPVLKLDAVSTAMATALGPVVGFFAGKCDNNEHLTLLRTVARAHEYVWIDCQSPKSASSDVSRLYELLLRVHAGREKFLLYGFPQSAAQASAFLETVGSPQFVLHSSRAASSVAQDVLDIFDARPEIVQADVAEAIPATTTAMAAMQSLFFRKRMVVVVGDVQVLDLPQLRDAVAPLGYDVLDVQSDSLAAPDQAPGGRRPEVSPDDEEERMKTLARRVQGVQAPRCLVIGAPETPSFYHTLEKHVGTALHQLLVLQQVKVRPRDPDALDDGEFSDDYSDEEDALGNNDDGGEEADHPSTGVKWRKVVQALSAPRTKLLQAFSGSSVSVDALGFLETSPRGARRVVQSLCSRLRPRFVGVVGHPFTFYEAAARHCCRGRGVGFVAFRGSQSSPHPNSLQALETLQSLVASTPYSSYCIDGFPRFSTVEENSGTAASPPRYVAQQLWELARRLGPMTHLVHFTTALEVLEERAPERVTRGMLDDAQDDVDLAAGDLLRVFSAAGQQRPAHEVTCDRTPQDAQDELGELLRVFLRPRQPGGGRAQA